MIGSLYSKKPTWAAPLHALTSTLRISLTLLILGVSVGLVQSQGVDEQYLKIWKQIQAADVLTEEGKKAEALSKYLDAHKALQEFRRDNPHWDRSTVAFRLNYLSQKATDLSDQLKEASRPKEQQSPTGTLPQGAGQQKLLEPGAEPRRLLRIKPSAGEAQTLTLHVDTTMQMTVAGMAAPAGAIPPVTIEMQVAVKDVSAEGDIGYEVNLGEIKLSESTNVLPQVAAAMKASLANLEGTLGTGTITSRGQTKSVQFKKGDGSAAKGNLGQLEDLLSVTGVVYPEEEVGVGAKWEVKVPTKSQGVTVDQSTTYELVSAEGERLVIKSSFTQRAANQSVPNPAGVGPKVNLVKLDGQGSGELVLDLSKVSPLSSTTKMKTSTTMTMDMQGQKQTITTTTEQKVTSKSES